MMYTNNLIEYLNLEGWFLFVDGWKHLKALDMKPLTIEQVINYAAKKEGYTVDNFLAYRNI